MSEHNPKQTKHYLLTGLVIFLVAIAGFQAWYMMNMKQQLDIMQGKHDTAAGKMSSGTSASSTVAEQIQKSLDAQASASQQYQANQQALPAPGSSSSLFDDDFFNRPFFSQNWSPYEEIERMQRHIDKVFNHAFSQFNNGSDFQYQFEDSASAPGMDVQEDDSKYTVTVNLPGADEKDISVNLDGQQLTVRGEQDFNQQKKDAMGNVIFQEHHTGTFQRSINLPEPVAKNGMKTHANNGVITIIIPKVS